MLNRRQTQVWCATTFFTLAMVCVSGCSTTFSLGYEMGPFLVSRELEKRLPLSEQAEDKLDRELEAYFEWHRRKMLPVYVVALEGWRVKVGTKRSTREWLWGDIEGLVADTLLPIGEIVCEPMSTYTPEDVAELRRMEAKARGEQKKRREDETPEERRERRWESFESFLEDWIGDLEESQVKGWRQTFEQAMNTVTTRRGKGREEFELFLRELEAGMSFGRCFEYMQGWLYPEPKIRAERNQHWVTVYDKVLSELSVEQRVHLDEELATWIGRFKGLQN